MDILLVSTDHCIMFFNCLFVSVVKSFGIIMGVIGCGFVLISGMRLIMMIMTMMGVKAMKVTKTLTP